jgi:hypothetical protein
MEIARRLRAARRDVRCRERHRVLQRPPGKLGVAPGRPLCNFFSRRRARTPRGAWPGEKSDHEDRGRIERLLTCARQPPRARTTRRGSVRTSTMRKTGEQRQHRSRPQMYGSFQKPPDSFYGREVREQPACPFLENTPKLLCNHLIALAWYVPRRVFPITISRMDHDFGGCAPRAACRTDRPQ